MIEWILTNERSKNQKEYYHFWLLYFSLDTQEKEIPINNIFYDDDIYSDNFWDFKIAFPTNVYHDQY